MLLEAFDHVEGLAVAVPAEFAASREAPPPKGSRHVRLERVVVRQPAGVLLLLTRKGRREGG
eukprot:796221-Prorocentrum_minimum.AAC.1